jgi:hypothetical protein
MKSLLQKTIYSLTLAALALAFTGHALADRIDVPGPPLNEEGDLAEIPDPAAPGAEIKPLHSEP